MAGYASEMAGSAEETKAEDPNRPLDSYFMEELTGMLHEATIQVSLSIDRRDAIRRMIDQKSMQVSENVTEADQHFRSTVGQRPEEGSVERPRF